MITEPEFDDGSGSPDRRDPHDPHDPRDPHERHGPEVYAVPRPGRRSWRWALGGALLASALWAGAWWALTPHDGRPPLRHALPVSLCDEAKLPGLARLSRSSGWDHTPRLWEHPGADRALCLVNTPPVRSEAAMPWLSYEAQVSVTLHKKTDPAPEFGAEPEVVGWVGMGDSLDRRSVPGLGERALISESEYGMWWRLTVLDGGAVFTLDVAVTVGWAGEGAGQEEVEEPKPDSDAIQAAMIDDMHVLMKALRT